MFPVLIQVCHLGFLVLDAYKQCLAGSCLFPSRIIATSDISWRLELKLTSRIIAVNVSIPPLQYFHLSNTSTPVAIMSSALLKRSALRTAIRSTAAPAAARAALASTTFVRGKATLPDLPCTPPFHLPVLELR